MTVIIQEDDKLMQATISEELKSFNYCIHFVTKNLSIFEVLRFRPDILIADYAKKQIINCYEWAQPY